MEAPPEAVQENQHGWWRWFIIVPVIIGIIAIMWSAQELKQQCPTTPPPVACPAGWVYYEGKCYFFSEDERSWTASQTYCALNESSLVVIESETEKVFLLRYKGTADHWIGLRKDPHQTWKWVDGTDFNMLLEVNGETEDCAFLSTNFVMSSDCHIARKWICRKPDAYTRTFDNMICGRALPY